VNQGFFARDGSFYAYDVSADTWAKQPGSDFFSPTTNADGGILSQVVATPVSSYGVVMFAKFFNSSSTVYLYKHTGGAATETSFSALEGPGILVQPNPAAAGAIIRLPGAPGSRPSEIRIFDVHGNLISSLPVAGRSAIEWRTHGVGRGVYIIRAVAGGQTFTARLLVQ
jgi:hypothetical protein